MRSLLQFSRSRSYISLAMAFVLALVLGLAVCGCGGGSSAGYGLSRSNASLRLKLVPGPRFDYGAASDAGKACKEHDQDSHSVDIQLYEAVSEEPDLDTEELEHGDLIDTYHFDLAPGVGSMVISGLEAPKTYYLEGQMFRNGNSQPFGKFYCYFDMEPDTDVTAEAVLTSAIVKQLSLSVPEGVSVPAGYSLPVKVTAIYSDDTTSDITKTAVIASSNADIASPRSDLPGYIKGVSVGEAVITATEPISVSKASVSVTVTDAVLDKMTLEPGPVVLPLGYTLPLVANGTFSDGSQRDISADVSWSVSEDIANISLTGILSGTRTGEAEITAKDPASGLAATGDDALPLVITDAKLEKLAVDPQEASIVVGLTKSLSAIGSFSDGSSLDLTNQTIWRTTNVGVASVDRKGAVTGVSQGTASIYVKDMVSGITSDDSSQSAKVTIEDATLVSIEIEPDHLTIADGSSGQLDAVGKFSDGSVETITDSVIWEVVSGDKIVSVSNADGSKGQVTALQKGSAEVSASLGDIVSKACPVTVTGLESIIIDPDEFKFTSDEPLQLEATGYFSEGSPTSVTSSANWSLKSGEGVVSVSNEKGSKGKVTPLREGTAEIVCSVGNVESSVCTVTVTGSFSLRFTGVTEPADAQRLMLRLYYTNGSGDNENVKEVSAHYEESGEAGWQASGDVILGEGAVLNHAVLRVIKDDGHEYAYSWWTKQPGETLDPNGENVFSISDNTFAGGTGTQADPYLVGNPRQLSSGVRGQASAGKYFKQIRDLDFDNACGILLTVDDEGNVIEKTISENAPFYNSGKGWSPISTTGTSNNNGIVYDGGNFLIRGIVINRKISENSVNLGLFGSIGQAYSRLENIKMTDGVIYADSRDVSYCMTRVGSVAGYGTANISSQVPNKIQSCHSDCVIVASGKGNQNNIYAGGIIGIMGGGIANCSYSGRIFLLHDAADSNTASNYAGGICGNLQTASSNISDSENSGSLNINIIRTCNTYAGGICGRAYASGSAFAFSGLNNRGEIFVNVQNADCGNTSTNAYVATGGIIGRLEPRAHTFSNCVNYGDVVAEVSKSSRSAYNTAGGIVGYLPNSTSAELTITSCRNSGKIKAQASSGSVTLGAGGIIGWNEYKLATLEDCANFGDIDCSSGYSGQYFGAGLAVYGGLTLSRCVNAGNVSVSSAGGDIYAAGLVNKGLNTTAYPVLDCLNVGSVTGSGMSSRGNIGGIAATGSSPAENCLNIGTVTSRPQDGYTFRAGAVMGYAYSGSSYTTANNYYLEGNTFLNDTLSDRGEGDKATDTDSRTKRITSAQLLNTEPVADEQILTKLLGEGNWQTNPYEDDELGKGIKKGMPVLKWMEPIQ